MTGIKLATRLERAASLNWPLKLSWLANIKRGAFGTDKNLLQISTVTCYEFQIISVNHCPPFGLFYHSDKPVLVYSAIQLLAWNVNRHLVTFFQKCQTTPVLCMSKPD